MDKLTLSLFNSPLKSYTAFLAAVFVGYLVIKGFGDRFFNRPSPHPYPPGPPRDPLLGALRVFPKDRFVDRFCEWAKAYGTQNID
jgi:hypothetical protein